MSSRLLTIAATSLLTLLPLALLGCTNNSGQNDQELRQKSAQATRDVRQGAKQLSADTKVAAAKAVNGVNAVAQGIKDGINTNKPGERMDVNSASTARLALLPGISLSKAQDIAKGRPYPSAQSLVSRGLLTQEQYNRIADQITAK